MLTIKTISATLAALAVSGGVAAAASATTDVNMRAGPGPEHQVVDVIPSGAPVDVLGCSGSWCQVNYAGRSGFASATYLSGEPRAAMMAPGMRGYAPTAQPAPAYGPTYSYVERGYAPYDGYAMSGPAANSYAYESDDDDDDERPLVRISPFGDRDRSDREWFDERW